MFDEAGFPNAKIVASNELDEEIIHSIRGEGGRIDIYGVGTKLATCAGEGGVALGGVYKLVRLGNQPKLKVTSDIAKATLPDRKRVLRAVWPYGRFEMDILCLEGEEVRPGEVVFDPTNPARRKPVPAGVVFEELRQTVMTGGEIVVPLPPLDALADRCADQLRRLPEGCLRLTNPHRYKVSMSAGLHALRSRLMEQYEAGGKNA
jgi:nicotinate phosphoribosyltransferase